jgi:hypothetical protein
MKVISETILSLPKLFAVSGYWRGFGTLKPPAALGCRAAAALAMTAGMRGRAHRDQIVPGTRASFGRRGALVNRGV